VGSKMVKFCDLTGDFAEESQLGRLVVLEHPELAEGPKVLEVVPGVIDGAKALDRLVTLDYYPPGADEPTRLVMFADDFDQLARNGDMAAVLADAQPLKVKRTRRNADEAGESAGYATLEHAGEPHRGITTEEEKRLVREHLEEVNARLRAKGLREIDPASPGHARRYGFVES